MKALLAFFLRVTPAAHDDTLRANQFNDAKPFSPYIAMLPTSTAR